MWEYWSRQEMNPQQPVEPQAHTPVSEAVREACGGQAPAPVPVVGVPEAPDWAW